MIGCMKLQNHIPFVGHGRELAKDIFRLERLLP
jgi:hypothetical protein